MVNVSEYPLRRTRCHTPNVRHDPKFESQGLGNRGQERTHEYTSQVKGRGCTSEPGKVQRKPSFTHLILTVTNCDS